MDQPVLLCVDGSELATKAVATGLALLAPERPLVLVTAVPLPDPTVVTGVGLAGGVMSEDEAFRQDELAMAEANAVLVTAQRELAVPDAERLVVRGTPGPAICELAVDRGAAGIVMGSRGRGGLKRAVLGSVSDHVVRNAPCPVMVTGAVE